MSTHTPFTIILPLRLLGNFATSLRPRRSSGTPCKGIFPCSLHHLSPTPHTTYKTQNKTQNTAHGRLSNAPKCRTNSTSTQQRTEHQDSLSSVHAALGKRHVCCARRTRPTAGFAAGVGARPTLAATAPSRQGRGRESSHDNVAPHP